jgi:predicted adenylyl cyclase CyaB
MNSNPETGMPRNVEIKASVGNVPELIGRARELATSGPDEIEQDDTFFRCANGRLKLRKFTDGSGELIFYRRPDRQGPKECRYRIFKTPDPDALGELLSLANGITGRVVKHRTLFLCGRTRIHVDRVKGLGDFLEIEVVLREGEEAEAGVAEAAALMEKLGGEKSSLIDSAYTDLISLKERGIS